MSTSLIYVFHLYHMYVFFILESPIFNKLAILFFVLKLQNNSVWNRINVASDL